MTPIKFSPEALEDLHGIRQYIAGELGNEQAAANTVAKVMKRVKKLAIARFKNTTILASLKTLVYGF